MTTEKTYPPDVLKEELEKELGLKFFKKDELVQIITNIVKTLTTDVRELSGRKTEKPIITTVEIPDIFTPKMKQEIETKNEIIRHFAIQKTNFCLQNDSDCIRNLILTATEGEEYRNLADFIDKNKNVQSIQTIYTNFGYYTEEIEKKKQNWNNGDITVGDDTAKKIAREFMKVFEEHMVDSVITAVYSALDLKQNEQINIELLEILNKYISAMGIYAPCDVLGGMKYDIDDRRFIHFGSEPFIINDNRFAGYIHSVIKLSYVMDYTYNGKTKYMCTKGLLFSFVMR